MGTSKWVHLRIQKSQNSLFALLGPAFSFRCLLSPVVKLHLFRTFVCPVLRSGLSSLVVKNTLISPLSIFQRKTLKGVLKVSKQASSAGIHFLTGEIPIEAKIHKDVFSLFFSVWTNPDSKIYSIVKYIYLPPFIIMYLYFNLHLVLLGTKMRLYTILGILGKTHGKYEEGKGGK